VAPWLVLTILVFAILLFSTLLDHAGISMGLGH